VTVEDDASWLSDLQRLAPDTELRYIPPPSGSNATTDGPFDEYAHAIDLEPDDRFDLVIVDGKARRDCVLAAEPKVKPGGMLLLDDSQASDIDPPPRANLTQLRRMYADIPGILVGWRVNHFRGIKPGTWLGLDRE
jgi:hypothetical protein